jgi:LAS seventeen-binding protein 5
VRTKPSALYLALISSCSCSLGAFTDPQFLDVLKVLWVDGEVDKRVKKRLTTILLAWQEQFKDDASMSVFAGLHARFKKEKIVFRDEDVLNYLGQEGPRQRKMRLESEKKERQEAARRERGGRREQEGGSERQRSFDFERVWRSHSNRVQYETEPSSG